MAFLHTTQLRSSDPNMVRGIGFGLLAASAWAFYTVASRLAVEQGYAALDLTALRYVVAALIFTPLVMQRGWRDLGGITWKRGAMLAIGAGPLFSLFYVFGLSQTPYAHGPVLSPSTVTLGSIMLAVIVLAERISPLRVIGASIVVAGLFLVVSNGQPVWQEASPFDLLFVASGLLWATFTVLLRKWGLDPVMATASVALISGLAMLPVLIFFADWSQLTENLSRTALHALIQGGIAASLAVVAFSKAVSLLGASKAGIFPSIVPVGAVLLGVPLLDEIPTAVQAAGVVLATVGLFVTTMTK